MQTNIRSFKRAWAATIVFFFCFGVESDVNRTAFTKPKREPEQPKNSFGSTLWPRHRCLFAFALSRPTVEVSVWPGLPLDFFENRKCQYWQWQTTYVHDKSPRGNRQSWNVGLSLVVTPKVGHGLLEVSTFLWRILEIHRYAWCAPSPPSRSFAHTHLFFCALEFFLRYSFHLSFPLTFTLI